MEKITASEAALHFKVSSQTIRRWIQSGKLHGFKENDQWYVEIDEQHHTTSVEQGVERSVAHDVGHLKDEIRHLRELLERRDRQNESQSQQIEGLTKQMDHLTQLLAMAQKQNQLLLEDKSKPSWWQKIWKRPGKSDKLQENLGT